MAFQTTIVLLATIASIYAAYRAGIVIVIEQAEINIRGVVVHFIAHLTVAVAGFNISLKCTATVNIIRFARFLIRLLRGEIEGGGCCHMVADLVYSRCREGSGSL